MWANVRKDCFSSFSEKSVEVRLAEAALREQVWALQRTNAGERGYLNVDQYDPVLRAHCRLDEPVQKK